MGHSRRELRKEEPMGGVQARRLFPRLLMLRRAPKLRSMRDDVLKEKASAILCSECQRMVDCGRGELHERSASD